MINFISVSCCSAVFVCLIAVFFASMVVSILSFIGFIQSIYNAIETKGRFIKKEVSIEHLAGCIVTGFCCFVAYEAMLALAPALYEFLGRII